MPLFCKGCSRKTLFRCAEPQLEQRSIRVAAEGLMVDPPRKRRLMLSLMCLAFVAPWLLAGALPIASVAPARAVSLSARTDRLIDRLQQLGVAIDRLER